MAFLRLLAPLFLLILSGALWRLVPERQPTLAELTPQNPLLFFEVEPYSMLRQPPGDGLPGQVTEEQTWLQDILQELPETDRQVARQLADDPRTRLAVSVFDLKSGAPDEVKVDFLLVAWVSDRNFADLVELGARSIRRAIPPGHYIEMQRKPRLGVMVGEPPKRLYVYEDAPVYLVSNSRDLVLRMLEIRYRGRPVLARQADFVRMRRAVPVPNGAILYVNLADLLARSKLGAVPFLSLLRTLNSPDLRWLGYHWDNVRGRIVRRVILP